MPGFTRTGGEEKVTFTLPTDLFSFVGEHMQRILECGTFDLMIGRSSEDLVFVRELSILGESAVLAKQWRCLSSVVVASAD